MTYKEVIVMLTKSRDEGRLRKKWIMPKYSLEMDLVPYLPKYKPLNFQSYIGKSSACQHIAHFKSQLGSMLDIDALKTRSFIGSLRGTAFDWDKQLQENSLCMGSFGREAFATLPRRRSAGQFELTQSNQARRQ